MKRRLISKCFLIISMIVFVSGCTITFNYSFDGDFNIDIKDDNNKQEKKASRNYIDEVFNPYFSLLNDNEKQIYYDIYEHARDFSNEMFELTYQIDKDRFSEIYHSVIYDNPDLFWLKNYYVFSDGQTSEVNNVFLFYSDKVNNDNFVLSNLKKYNENEISKYKEKKNEIDNIVNSIIIDANKYESNIEKEKYVHNYLINKITYDLNTKNDQSLYSALALNKSVCIGYAKAFQYIMNKLNIPTYLISGNTTVAHAWNLILLDGKYYNVDVTNDDYYDDLFKVNTISYSYFNISDDEISKTHTRTGLSTYLPTSN